MKQADYTTIEKLVQRFFDGETDRAEEKELYAFFSREEIPEALEKYRSVFAYFERDLSEELSKKNPELIPFQVPSQKKSYIKLGVAVLLSGLILLSGLLYFNKPQEKEENYVVINGKKITDPRVVEAQMNAVLLEYILEEIEINALLMDYLPGSTDKQWDRIEVTFRE
jgi:hypothetical protein